LRSEGSGASRAGRLVFCGAITARLARFLIGHSRH
jgi:hypothetical protein